MEETSKRRWTTVVFFSALLLLFSGFIYFLVFGPKDSRYNRIRSQSSRTTDSTVESRNPNDLDQIVLPIDQKIIVNNLILIYKGKQRRTIFIDVIIPDLDPDAAYHHDLSIAEAEEAFNLASQRFRLTSSSHSIIRIERLH